MHKWLYSENGYYASMPDIGKDGDFYTSVSTSMFFGGCIANRLLKSIDEGFLSKDVSLVEVGSHKGYLLADMIQFIFTLRPELLKSMSFYVVEPLERVRQSQREYFEQCFGDKLCIKIVKSLDELELKQAFVVANELFDAFVCELVHDGKMLYVEDGRFCFKKPTKKMQEKMHQVTKGEIPLGLDGFASSLSKAFDRYEFVSFDYGDMGAREDISLRVYKNHKVYPFFELVGANLDANLDEYFGKSDITYDVNFCFVKTAFEKSGALMEDFCTQSKALVDFGLDKLLHILHQNANEKAYKKELEKAKQLILPEFFGQRFKMIRFRKA